MGILGCNNRRKIVAFSPRHYLKPPATTKERRTTRRIGEDKFTGSNSSSSSSSNYSSSSSNSRKRKKIHRLRCLVTNEPSSPKVDCMGHVKGCSGGKDSSLGRSPPLKNKLFHLLVTRIFSGRRSMTIIVGKNPRACARVRDDSGVSKVYVVDFDRPLPVVRHVATSDAVVQSDNLWKRRCGCKGLQVLKFQNQ